MNNYLHFDGDQRRPFLVMQNRVKRRIRWLSRVLWSGILLQGNRPTVPGLVRARNRISWGRTLAVQPSWPADGTWEMGDGRSEIEVRSWEDRLRTGDGVGKGARWAVQAGWKWHFRPDSKVRGSRIEDGESIIGVRRREMFGDGRWAIGSESGEVFGKGGALGGPSR